MSNEIAIFDSGVGGLKILQGLRKVLPNENYVYAFDRTFAPYGNKSERAIIRRAEHIVNGFVKRKVKAVVIACNTATAVAVEYLRARFSIDIFGVEPPVVPALKVSGDGKILLLCTPLTAKTKRLQRLCLMRDDIIISPQKTLATAVEREFLNIDNLTGEVDKILSAYDNEKIKAVALGCTHYYYLKSQIENYYKHKVPVFTATDGVCKRVKSVLCGRLNEGKGGFVKYLYF